MPRAYQTVPHVCSEDVPSGAFGTYLADALAEDGRYLSAEDAGDLTRRLLRLAELGALVARENGSGS